MMRPENNFPAMSVGLLLVSGGNNDVWARICKWRGVSRDLTNRNIPLSAYGYVVNGKPALEWVMER